MTHMLGRAALAGLVLLLSAGPAQSLIVYHSYGGCSLGGGICDPGLNQTAYVPPTAVTSGGDFSWQGALCPVPPGPDYACGSIFGQATHDSLGLTMRAACNLRRHDAASGAGRQVYAGAEIEVYGMTGSIATPTAGFAKFHFGLGGTYSATSSGSAVTVIARGYATLNADTQHYIQCTGTDCGGVVSECTIGSSCAITVPYALDTPGAWSPGFFGVRLRTDVSSGATPFTLTGWDAEAFANFEDTLALTAITVEDMNHQPVPGAYFTIPDADGMGNDFIVPSEPPPITTTTLATASSTTTITTTTTTLATTSSTTTLATASTTTTLPGCTNEASYPSVRCRLDALGTAVEAGVPAGRLATKLGALIGRTRGAVTGTEAATTPRKRKKGLKGAIRTLGSFAKKLRTKQARTLDEALRTTLGTTADALRTDLKALKAR
jgi:hypothetical protein